ncbi:hypothetical protein ACQKKE_03525 [Desemzia incerta]|uniref:hypothetical protein n=1 Tax=Desemzia incerta TaxID=82801 RepID=UPI003D01107B
MPKEHKEIQYAVGIEDLLICMMETDETSDTLPTYSDTIYSQSNIVSLGITATTSNFVKWASNKKIINITKNTSFGLAFALAGLNREVKDLIFGKTATKGVSFENAKAKTYPKFAVGVVFPLNDGTKVVRWYPKCSVAPIEETWNTQNDEMTVDDISYTITADPLLTNDNTQAELDTGRTSAVTVDQFLAQVVCDESQVALLEAPTTEPTETPVGGE